MADHSLPKRDAKKIVEEAEKIIKGVHADLAKVRDFAKETHNQLSIKPVGLHHDARVFQVNNNVLHWRRDGEFMYVIQKPEEKAEFDKFLKKALMQA